MRHIMLSSEYVEAVLSGKKRATIRLSKPRLRPGDEAYVHAGGKIVALVRVRRVYPRKFEELTEEDAKKDGFDSLEELREALTRHYGDLRGKRLRVVEFELIKPLEMPESGGNPVELAELALKALPLAERERRILETLVRTGSIRKTAEILYGDPLRRRPIRRLLKRLRIELGEKNLLDNSGADHGQRNTP